MKTARRFAPALAALSVSAIAAAYAEPIPWPNKTGPMQQGVALPEDAKGLPSTWNEETGENIAWKINIEGAGHSTPVIGNGKLWFTSATEDGKKQYIYCVDAKTGDVLHHKLLFENEDPEPLNNPINTYASPSCVLEQDGVYVHFGTYGTARLDPETAEVVWQRRDINARHFRGPGSSPAVHGDLIVLTFDGVDRQYVSALNKQTGETVWLTKRSTDYGDIGPDGKPRRDGDLRKAYSTAGFVEVAGRVQVVSVGSRAAFGYDLLTGEEVWTVEHDDYNASARPIFPPGLAVINTGSRGANLMAIRLDSTTRGNITQSHVVWDRKTKNSDLSWPALTDGRIVMLTNNGVLYVVDAETGEDMWVGRVSGNFCASPLVASGMVYCFDERGTSTVFRLGDQLELVAKNQLADGMRASAAVADGALYLRTFDHLYKIAQE